MEGVWGYFNAVKSVILGPAARHGWATAAKTSATARHTFCEGNLWRGDFVAVAYQSCMLNQTLTKNPVANLSLGVAKCGHKPNNP